MRPGIRILPQHGFKHMGNHYATLSWFGTKIGQKYTKRIKTKQKIKSSGFRRDVKRYVLTLSTSGQSQVTTRCTCAVTSRKKCHVSGCRRQAGDVCCFRCLLLRVSLPNKSEKIHNSLPRSRSKDLKLLECPSCSNHFFVTFSQF